MEKALDQTGHNGEPEQERFVAEPSNTCWRSLVDSFLGSILEAFESGSIGVTCIVVVFSKAILGSTGVEPVQNHALGRLDFGGLTTTFKSKAPCAIIDPKQQNWNPQATWLAVVGFRPIKHGRCSLHRLSFDRLPSRNQETNSVRSGTGQLMQTGSRPTLLGVDTVCKGASVATPGPLEFLNREVSAETLFNTNG